MANEKFRGVRLQLSAGSLRVSCTNNEQEEAVEELEVAYQGESLETSFNISFLLDMLRAIGDEEVQIAFGAAAQSTLFTLPEQANFKYVVMPMRL